MKAPTKRKRAQPVDRRKLPEFRAPLDIIRKYNLLSGTPLHTGFWVLATASGDWDKVEKFFQSSKAQIQRERWQEIRAVMIENRAFLYQLHAETAALYRQYSRPVTDAIQ